MIGAQAPNRACRNNAGRVADSGITGDSHRRQLAIVQFKLTVRVFVGVASSVGGVRHPLLAFAMSLRLLASGQGGGCQTMTF